MGEGITFKNASSRIYLIGMMGAGKSLTGRLLARSLNYEFVDTDELVEAQGATISDIFKSQGEEAFRKMEREVLQTCVKMEKTVIATGGGLPCHYDNLDIMLGSGAVMYLKAAPVVLAERLDRDDAQRPLLSDASELRMLQIESILHKRRSCYERAHHIVDTDGDESSVVVGGIVEVLMG